MMRRGNFLKLFTALCAIFLVSGSVALAGDGKAVVTPIKAPSATQQIRIQVDTDKLGDTPAAVDNPLTLHPWDIPQNRDSSIIGGDGGPVTSHRSPELDSERPESSAKGVAAGRGNLPHAIELGGNYPNPFNAQTRIEFSLREAGSVQINVYNLLGGVVRTMALNGLSAGPQNWVWDGRVEGGGEAPSGIYFYKITNGKSSVIAKMVLLK